ncbi:hypothetical protein Pmar_PMAR005634 [Perkinsus marinus ATCC 50983]|uniref:Uncharacterized protein n=1 Tax=Perkinsus marinus (strain ATCC 50983 / TXsc) TaxID=423536 RepID=C5L147_PERM5|nr:hypothetical protein Pmar_PMAR005634 [Perkinsus marinus ATCC 50983]EER09545.1 hypothetical protein Pmar_PMAR005634 [Perkinsus marinus ATCC 50983]|eukprot:XP_002777750.1 hypothetical protein Pmar_PMAR005634 [Perkinsus marinus ATCC 50983]
MITCPLPLKESKLVVLALWKSLIAVHGVPYRLHSDRGEKVYVLKKIGNWL